MNFILIAMFWGSFGGTSFTQEFENKVACERAKDVLLKVENIYRRFIFCTAAK